jgi:putative molybdopterin biosynthesis protein
MANRLREVRNSRSISQTELARRVAMSRQALSAVEQEIYQPGVGIALRLARELDTTVEELFGAPKTRRLVVHAPGPTGQTARVGLVRTGGRLTAVPLAPQNLTLSIPGGAIAKKLSGNRVEVDSFRSSAEIDRTLIVAGCDPAIALVRDFLMRRSSPIEVIPFFASSCEALSLVARGVAHIAGIHLRDPISGDFNFRAARAALGARRFRIVRFARWELGLASRIDREPIKSVDDLTRRGVRLINRESGAGARAALDETLAQAGIKPSRIQGYKHLAGGHLEIAATIAHGEADAGVTIRLAAELNGLRFQPWREERYDLIVAERELTSPPVTALLEALNSRDLARQIERLCTYDSREMGRISA